MRSAEAFDFSVGVTVDELLARAYRRLSAAPFRPQRREARLLLARVLGWDEPGILSRGETPISIDDAEKFEDLIRRRLEGEPVAYLLNEREFFGLPFYVDSRVLIPRPETEHLIEVLLDMDLPREPRILDLGTGSGCIAVTLACELPSATLLAVDASLAALAAARVNVLRHDVADRVELLAADLASAVELGAFDVVVSNPPYVDPRDESALSVEITGFEPTEAVFAPTTGESVLRRLITESKALRPGRSLLLEIGKGQATAISSMLDQSSFELMEIHPDLAAIPRVVVARRS